MRALRVPLLILAAIIVAAVTLAQVSTSRLEGTVQDATGAVVPSASVVVVNNKTQVRLETSTGAQGQFIFPSLPPGEYTLTVEAAGFSKAVRSGLVMNVSNTVTEVITLEVGSVNDSVVVEASAVRVQTADAQVARAITLRDIDVLPQLGRGPIALAIFTTGVQIDPSDTTFSRVNGTRQGSNNTTLDGIDVNDVVVPRLGLAMTPNNTDTVEEFRMVTNGGKAEYGRSAGAQVELITRSGTNNFHGAAYDYLRNTKLNAGNFFSKQSGAAPPKYIRNIFGGRFEGPILKDRTFFMGNYEGGRTRQELVRNRTVLTPEAKQGLFRWKTPNTSNVQSFDIAKNDPRGIGIDPAVKKILKLLPDPNNTDIGDGLNTAGFRFNNPNNSFNDQFTIKVDHNLWAGHRTFFRWSWMRTYSGDGLNGADAPYPGLPQGTQGGRRWGWAGGSDWVINPTTVNEFRVGFQKNTSAFLRPGRLPEPMMVSNSWTDPLATGYAQGRTPNFYEFTDNLTKIKSKHNFKMGAQLRFTTQWGYRDDYIWPNVYFSRSYGNAPSASIGPSGSTVIASADRTRFENLYNDLLGRISDVFGRYYSDLEQWQKLGTSRVRTHKFHEYGYFFQDDWKVRPNLTVNLGVRWEFFGVPYEVNALEGTLDRANLLDHLNRWSDATVRKTTQPYNNDWNNFAPRVGFAWDIFGNGKTALRGNWGVFYDRMVGAAINTVDLATPGFSQDVRVMPNQAPGSDVRFSDGIPSLPQPAAPVLQVPANRQSSVTVFAPNLRTGYVLHNSINIQQELFRNGVLEVGYVGTRGIKLFSHVNVNQPRIYDDFLKSFKELQAFRANKTPVSAGNTIVKLFGSEAAAITAIGGTTIDTGAVATAADTVDRTYYTKYAAAGVSDYYLRNFPQFNLAYRAANDGRTYYDSLQVSFRRQQGALKFNANYTYSKALDNWANEGNGSSAGSLIDHYNVRLNRGRADFDRPHVFNSTFIYTLPVGKGRRFAGSAPVWVDTLIGGWDLGILSIWESGGTFTVSSGRATGPNPGANSWADYSGSRNIGSLVRGGDGIYYFTEEQKAQFTYPNAGEIGTSGRNTFRGPRFFNLDTSLVKKFRVTESSAVSFRAEAYNLLNNANFAAPGSSLATLQSFGKISSTVGNSRIMQMALRFDF